MSKILRERFIKNFKPWHIFLCLTLIIAVVNHKWGSAYVGLDNISPFWGIKPVIAQIEHAQDFFAFGPILFSWWFYALSALTIPASAISFVYVYAYMFISLLGYFNLAVHLLKRPVPPWLFATVFVSSLVPLWIFTTHELMFMSIFASFPWIYLWLSSADSIKGCNGAIFTILLSIPLLFSSACNLVVFASGIVGLFIIAVVNREFTRSFVTRLVLICVGFILLMQLLIFPTRGFTSLTSELQQHSRILSESKEMQQITVDLQKSELQNASFTNAARFATGWLALFDEKGKHVFSWAEIYRNNLLVIIIQIITSLGVVSLPWLLRTSSKVKRWSILFITCSLLLSVFGLTLLAQIPLLNILFRSASTKLWMLLFVPYLVLGVESGSVISRKSRTLGVFVLVLFVFPAFPWYLGQMYNSFNAPTIPHSFETFYTQLPTTTTVLTFPKPQAIYFRKYTWGYYGSGLTSYMTEAKTLDGGSISQSSKEYSDYLRYAERCEIQPFLRGDIIITIEDESASVLCPRLIERFDCNKDNYFIVCVPNQTVR